MRQIIEVQGQQYLRCCGYKNQPAHIELIENFPKDKTRAHGLAHQCKACIKRKNKDTYDFGTSANPRVICPTCGSKVDKDSIEKARIA